MYPASVFVLVYKAILGYDEARRVVVAIASRCSRSVATGYDEYDILTHDANVELHCCRR